MFPSPSKLCERACELRWRRLWLAGSVVYLINQGIGCIQIMRINNKRLHPEFHVGKINLVLLPLATLTRWASVAVWLYAGGFAEIVRRWQAGG